MGDSTLKVTDKRLFTPEGELRQPERAESDAPPSRAAAEAAADAPPADAPGAAQPPPPPSPELAPDLGFYDLVAALVEPAAVYLGDATLPDGTLALDLGLARAHIDLLAVLQAKTAGNLTADEAAALEDVLYRLRMRYVQKRG